jgi:amino acid permease
MEEIVAETIPEQTEETGLVKGLKRRHMNLIALGGVIGAGLFVGSGVVIGDGAIHLRAIEPGIACWARRAQR